MEEEEVPVSRPRNLQRFRLLAIIPTILSAITFALQLTATLSGTNKHGLQYSIMKLNTSTIFQNMVQYSPANEISTQINKRFNPLDPFGLFPTPTRTPTPLSLTSALPLLTMTTAIASIVSGLPVPSPTALPSDVDPTSAISSLTSALASVNSELPVPLPTALPTSPTLGSLNFFGNVTVSAVFQFLLNSTIADIDDALTMQEAILVKNLTTALGLRDFYSLYLEVVCGWDSEDIFNPHSPVIGLRCFKYTDLFSGLRNSSVSHLPSSFVVLGTNVTIPLLAQLPIATDGLNHLSKVISTISRVFHVISLIGTAGTAVLSLIAFFLPDSWLIVEVATITSLLSTSFQTGSTILLTIFINSGTPLINKYFNVWGIYAYHGKAFLIITWIAFVLAQIAGLYWDAVWFVETRRSSFRRRNRTESEKGNWKGIFSEVKADWKRPARDAKDDMEATLVEDITRADESRRRSLRQRSTIISNPATVGRTDHKFSDKS